MAHRIESLSVATMSTAVKPDRIATVTPTLNPHPHLSTMKDLFDTSEGADEKALSYRFFPFLRNASHEEWQFTLQHAWASVIGPLEWKLYKTSGQVIDIGLKLKKDVSQVWHIQNHSFAQAPCIIKLSCDPIAAGISRRDMLICVVKALVMVAKKKGAAEKCEEMLKTWQAEARRKETAIPNGNRMLRV